MASTVKSFRIDAEGAHPREVPAAASDVHDSLDREQLGIYTAFRTYGGQRFFGLERHLDRADQSMQLSGWTERLDRRQIRRALQQAVDETPHAGHELKIRLDVLAPAAAPGGGLGGRLLLTLAPFEPVPEAYRRDGVRVEVAERLQRATPRIKHAQFAVDRRPYPLNRRDCYEHLLLDDQGFVLEATSANVFARHGDELWTAPDGVLEGITRRVIFECCAELGYELRLDRFRLEELQGAREAFLSNSTQGIIPIVNVCGQPLGDGRPGPWTGALAKALTERIESTAEPAWPLADAQR